jgi:hypothetical protein
MKISKCPECIYNPNLSIDHVSNREHKKHIEIQQILMQLGLPPEITIIIINFSIDYQKCGFCDVILCRFHYLRGIYTEMAVSYFDINRSNNSCYHEIY